MRVSFVSLLAFGLAFLALADDQPVYHIHQLDPNVNVDELKGSNVVVHPVQENTGSGNDWKIPEPQVVDAAIVKSGLSENLPKRERMSSDLLYIRARDLPLAEFMSQYPKLPKEKLQALRKIATNNGEKK